jgi:GNAT superfamily N-acetyltransferase
MRDGDLGVVAERPGAPLGAAWVRRFSGQELGPWDDPEVPVLAVAVERPFRGMGVGMALLKTLLAFATDEGVRAIDLTTGTFNEAAVRLYHSCGFVDIAQRGEAVRMRVVLHPGPSA